MIGQIRARKCNKMPSSSSLIVRKNHAVPSTHNQVGAQSCFVVLMSTKQLRE